MQSTVCYVFLLLTRPTGSTKRNAAKETTDTSRPLSEIFSICESDESDCGHSHHVKSSFHQRLSQILVTVRSSLASFQLSMKDKQFFEPRKAGHDGKRRSKCKIVLFPLLFPSVFSTCTESTDKYPFLVTL
jgi:hypothetical protein